MQFILTCSRYFFDDESKPQYEAMGFKFIKRDDLHCWHVDLDNCPTIIFNDIEVLKLWVNKIVKFKIIIDFEDMEIEIYDDYRE